MKFNEKKHFKMYKAGRRWVVAAIAVASIMGTGALGTQAAFATGEEPTTGAVSTPKANDLTPTDPSQPAVPAADSNAEQQSTQAPAATPVKPSEAEPAATTPTPAPATKTPAPVPAPVADPAPVAEKKPAIAGNIDGKTFATATTNTDWNLATATNGVTVGNWLSGVGTDGKPSVSSPTVAPTDSTRAGGTSAVDPNASDLKAHYLIANNTDNAINGVTVQMYFPENYEQMNPQGNKLHLDSNGTLDDLLAQLNAFQGATYTFGYGTSNNAPTLTLDKLKALPGYNYAMITSVQALIPVFDAHASLEYYVPVIVGNGGQVAHDDTATATTGVSVFNSNWQTIGKSFNQYFLSDNLPAEATTTVNPNGGSTETTPGDVPANPIDVVTTSTPVTAPVANSDTDTAVATTGLPDTDGGTAAHATLPDTFGGSDGSQAAKVASGTAAQRNAGRQVTLPATSGSRSATASAKPLANVVGAQKQATLPQTGDAHNSGLTLIGMALAGIISLFGLGRKQRAN